MKLSISFVLLFALLAIAAALPTGKTPRKMRLKSLRATAGRDPCTEECTEDPMDTPFFSEGGCKKEVTALDGIGYDPHPACDKVGETHCCSATCNDVNGMCEPECISKKNQVDGWLECDKPSPPAEIICEKDTEGTCAVLGCDGWRNSKCDKDTDKCMCPEGTCRTEIDGHDDGYGCVNPRPWLAVGNDETRVSEDAIAEAIKNDPVRARRNQKRERKPRKKKVTDLPVLRTDFDEPEEAQPMYEDMKFTQNEFRQAP